MRTFKFALLENALDSLSQGVSFALKDHPSPSDLKLSVLLIAQAVELLLKERLRQEHWSLIFKDVEKAGKPNANTVTISEALNRLEHIAKVEFEKTEKDTIFNLAEIRNQIQHFEIEVPFEEVVGKAHVAIAFVTRFLNDEFEKDISEYLEQDDIEKLLQIEDVLKHLQEMARQKIEKIREESLPRRPKDQMNWQFDIIICPKCLQDFYIFSPDSHISQCQLCKHEGGFVECARCGLKFPSDSSDSDTEDEGAYICDSCWEDIRDE